MEIIETRSKSLDPERSNLACRQAASVQDLKNILSAITGVTSEIYSLVQPSLNESDLFKAEVILTNVANLLRKYREIDNIRKDCIHKISMLDRIKPLQIISTDENNAASNQSLSCA